MGLSSGFNGLKREMVHDLSKGGNGAITIDPHELSMLWVHFGTSIEMLDKGLFSHKANTHIGFDFTLTHPPPIEELVVALTILYTSHCTNQELVHHIILLLYRVFVENLIKRFAEHMDGIFAIRVKRTCSRRSATEKP